MGSFKVSKRNSQLEIRQSVDETAGLAVDTTKDMDVNTVPEPVRTGNGKGRTTKETAAKTAETAQKSTNK